MKISQKIIDYAIWYYLKYYPSPKKLTQKLLDKFWIDSENWQKYWWIKQEEIDFIFWEKLRNIIQEDEVIKSKIKNYKLKWKSKLYIKQKLFERQENKDLIEKYLKEAFFDWEIEQLEKEYNKIKNKLNTNKMEFNQNIENTEEKEYIFENKQKQKIIEKLYRKWFKYDDIKRLF